MATKTYSVLGQNRSNTVEAIREREEFVTLGALKAREYAPGLALFAETGQLNADGRDAFRSDRDRIDYIVYSYSTPIAWHTVDGEWFVVAQKFSNSTARHKSIVRDALSRELVRTVGV